MNLTNQKLNQAIKLIQDCIKSEEIDVPQDRPLRNEDGVIIIKRPNTINPKQVGENSQKLLDKLKNNPPIVKSKNISITLDDVEQKRYNDFIAEHEDCQKYTGAIGVNSVELVATHTSVGYLLTARCSKCKVERNLTNYDNF